MKILALEFSSPRRSVALADDGTVLAEAVEQTSGRGTNAFGLIEKVLTESKISRAEIEVIAIGLGPGSYTGIRAAIAIGQGWQLARGVKLIGVSSAEAIAAQAQNVQGHLNVVIDAQRGEFYLGTWDISTAGRRELSPLKIITAAEFATLKSGSDICLGPEMAPPVFPAAATVAQLALARTDFIDGEKLEPIYLREPTFVKAPASRQL